MKSRGALFAAAFAASTLLAQAAAAHTPYVLPRTFAPHKDMLTIEAGVAEGGFFISDFPINGAEYFVTAPDGAVAKMTDVTTLKEYVLLQAAVAQPGTYKVSTGETAGRRGRKMAKIDGVWRNVRPAGPARQGAPPRPAGPAPEGRPAAPPPIDEADIPAGAEVMTLETVQRSEAYATRGAPSPAAIKPAGKGFELAPITHPNEIYVDEGFSFTLLNDGQPVADSAFAIYKSGDVYAERRFKFEGKTDAKGVGKAAFTEPGVYLLEARYSGGQGGAPAAKTYRYTLTFEVTR